MTHGPILVARRRTLKMTQDHLAGAASVSRSTVQRAERGLAVSDENLRSLLAVLGLDVRDLAAVPETGAATEPPQDPVGTGWVHSAECIPLCVLFVAFVMVRTHPEWINPDPVTAEDASRRFHLLLGYLGIGLAGCTLAGRILWRRWRAPGTNRITLLSWRTVWRLRLPVPGIRWTSMGRPVPTWAGGLLGAGLAFVMTFAAHYPTVGNLLNSDRASLGFDDAYKVSAAWAIDPASPMAEAGLKVGDLVLAVGGSPVASLLDLVASVRDAEGSRLDVRVARPRPKGANEKTPAAEMLTLQVQPGRDPAGCPSGTPCGWVGNLNGLFTPIKTAVPLEAQVRMFAREVATVSRLVVDPEFRAYSELRVGHEHGFRTWLDWLTFRMAAGTGITLTLIALVSAILGHVGQQAYVTWASCGARPVASGNANVAAG